MKKILNYDFYRSDLAINVGTYITDSFYLPYDKFLFIVRAGLSAAGKTIDVTLQVYHPEHFHADWLDYFHFVQIDSDHLENQFKEFNQILGKFRFKIECAGTGFVTTGEDWVSIGAYLGEM